MLKTILLIAALLAGPALAQPGSTATPGGKRGPGMRKIISQLNLNDQQKADIQKIMDSGVHGKERREAIAKVLTPEQAAKFKTLVEQQRQQQGQPTQPAP